jgi:hypothetical protein
MASDYGLNFGFLRSDESLRGTEGRFKTPVASSLLIGSVVEINPASAGYLKQSATSAVPKAGYCGLLVQELDWDRSIYESGPDMLDSFQLGVAKADRLSVLTWGAGVKFWLKNTSGVTRADGRVISARTTFSGSPAVGDGLYWDGAKFAKVTAAQPVFATVVAVNSATFIEATLSA